MELVDFILRWITILIAMAGGFWALSKFIIERGMIPAVELDIACTPLGRRENHPVLELVVIVSNVGSSVLVPHDIRIRIKTLGADGPTLYCDVKKRGRLKFPRHFPPAQLIEQPGQDTAERSPENDFIFLIPSRKEDDSTTNLAGKKDHKLSDSRTRNNTFVLPGVQQKYTYVTAVEPDTEFVHVSAEFDYNVRFQGIAKKVLGISKRAGLIQYDLDSILKAHSIERAFCVQETGQGNS